MTPVSISHGDEVAVDIRVDDHRREIWCGVVMSSRNGDGICIRPWGHVETHFFRGSTIVRVALLTGIDDDTRTKYTRRQRDGQPAESFEV